MTSRTAAALLVGLVTALPGAAQEPSAGIPIENLGWLVVPVRLNDDPEPLRFILDTAATGTSVTESTAARFGTETDRYVEVQGASGSVQARVVRLEAFTIGRYRDPERHAITLPDDELTAGTVQFDGIVGADVLSSFDVLIDAPRARLHLVPPGTRPAGVDELGPPIAINLIADRIIRHSAEVNDVAVTALLDSGARHMLINRAGGAMAGIAPQRDSAETGSPGLGDEEFSFNSGSLGNVVVAATSLTGLRTMIGDLPVFRALGLDRQPTLIIGAPVLSRCAVFIAYSARTIQYCRAPAPPS